MSRTKDRRNQKPRPVGRLAHHNDLIKVMVRMPSDFSPYGDRERIGGDCSCGCRYYLPLAGDLGSDWGVCGNVDGPRYGLLTFEHQGCPEYKP